jgi:hypothetical protein
MAPQPTDQAFNVSFWGIPDSHYSSIYSYLGLPLWETLCCTIGMVNLSHLAHLVQQEFPPSCVPQPSISGFFPPCPLPFTFGARKPQESCYHLPLSWTSLPSLFYCSWPSSLLSSFLLSASMGSVQLARLLAWPCRQKMPPSCSILKPRYS